MNIKTLVVVSAVLAATAMASTDAAAQGYYSRPAPNSVLPGGFHNRQGRIALGISANLGGMNDSTGDIRCDNCSNNPLAAGLAGHIGGFIGPRLALMLELQTNIQQVSLGRFPEDDRFLHQDAAMIAAQFWVTPQLWIKGGIGFAHLQVDDAFFIDNISNGTALLGAAGFELFSSRYMSIDLQGRILNGSYKGIDENITSASVGVGINWF